MTSPTTTTPAPKVGDRFRHRYYRVPTPGVRTADSPHEVCKISAIRKGQVHFATADGAGARRWTTVEKLSDYVMEWLS